MIPLPSPNGHVLPGDLPAIISRHATSPGRRPLGGRCGLTLVGPSVTGAQSTRPCPPTGLSPRFFDELHLTAFVLANEVEHGRGIVAQRVDRGRATVAGERQQPRADLGVLGSKA